MARKLALATFVVLGLLTLALPLTFLLPPGPPDVVTPSGEAINDVYWIVMAACAVVFLLLETALLLFVFRYRRRPGTPETAEGPQIHGNTRLEIIWTVVPALALAVIAVIVFLKTPAARGGPPEDPLRVSVEAHQFYWQYEYPDGVVALDRLRLPVDRDVSLELKTLDVEHSWWAPELTGKLDVIPGRVNVLTFKPTETGSFRARCAEFCGVQHPLMNTDVEVVSQEEFDAWLARQAERRPEEFGEEVYEAVCGKCHGFEGEGDVGPPIAGSPQLQSADSMRKLLSAGQDTDTFASYMPPNLAAGWPAREFDALMAYFKENPRLGRREEE